MAVYRTDLLLILKNLLRNATNPGALAEADMNRVRELMGDDAANSLEKLAQLTKMLEESGMIQQKEGKLELTPKGLRKIGNNALRRREGTTRFKAKAQACGKIRGSRAAAIEEAAFGHLKTDAQIDG